MRFKQKDQKYIRLDTWVDANINDDFIVLGIDLAHLNSSFFRKAIRYE